MSIQVTLSVTASQLAQIAAIMDGEPPAAEPKAAPKRAAVDKPKPEPADKTASEVVADEEQAGEASDVPSIDVLKDVSAKLVAANGREAMAELLEEIGAKNLSAIPEGERQAYLDKANAKLAKS